MSDVKAAAQLESRHGIEGQTARSRTVAEELYAAAKKAHPDKDIGKVEDYLPSAMTVVDTITTKGGAGRGWMGVRFEVPYLDEDGYRRTRTNMAHLHISDARRRWV